MKDDKITLAHGAGGKEMEELIKRYSFFRGDWKNCSNDASTFNLGDKELLFTTDSFVVDPIFFPGGNIGHLAFAGTVNDILMMGGTPIGLSISAVIEEGFPIEELDKIIETIIELSKKYNVPVVTGDTKVMEKGKIDKIILNTSAVGLSENILTKKLEVGDKVILSGGLGEHAVALLSKRFDFETEVITDSKPLVNELNDVKKLIKQCKDPTRGGISASLNEIAEKNSVGILLDEEKIPAKNEVRKAVEMLGINLYELACEGRFVSIVSKENAEEVITKLKRYNSDASIIGEVVEGENVVLQTFLGKRILPKPSGRIVPRIC